MIVQVLNSYGVVVELECLNKNVDECVLNYFNEHYRCTKIEKNKNKKIYTLVSKTGDVKNKYVAIIKNKKKD